jgi:hypothetical protein
MTYDTKCVKCSKKTIYSDPNFYEFDDGTSSPKFGICRKCWKKISDETSWINEYRKKIQIPIYQYIKVPIPHKLRWFIWKRDNFTCKNCFSRDDLTIDHIKPEISGGSLDPENLQTLCRKCNSIKNTKYG